jgi:endo-1,4-beta-D-glucanase Y
MKEFAMFKVTYIAKDKKGYLIDKNKNFKSLKEAYGYMVILKAQSKSIGQPVLEKVS